MKSLVHLVFLFCFTITSFAQKSDLNVHNVNGKLFLMHKVVPKENWYSVGRIYNVSPKELAPFNSLTLQNPLIIGQELKIPLNGLNFAQNSKKGADETLVPVYHLVQANESLSNISINYNKVPLENLEKWNKIKKESIKDGSRLIVGYLKVKTALSYLAKEGFNESGTAVTGEQQREVSEDIPIAKETKKPTPRADKPLNDLKQEPKTVTNPVTPANELKAVYTNNTPSNTSHLNGGYFSADYYDGGKSTSGMAGTFKSSSGWNDGKYYLLINNVPVGTIVKVVVPTTQKAIYAKVLGQLPDMKESEGLLVRISNAAASELGAGEGKFNVQVKY